MKNIFLLTCIVTISSCGGESSSTDSNYPTQRPLSISADAPHLLMSVDWNNRAVASYDINDTFADFNIKDSWVEGLNRAEILEETELKTSLNRFLRVFYPIHQYGPKNSGISFRGVA